MIQAAADCVTTAPPPAWGGIAVMIFLIGFFGILEGSLQLDLFVRRKLIARGWKISPC